MEIRDLRGTVADQSGSVLPGVTITATSPALLGQQTAVTSETGNYRFPAVPPGTYTLTYELAGFNTVRREGIQITLGFTANVNVELALATLQETVTVTGQTPVVDVQSVKVQQTLSDEVISAIPSSRNAAGLQSLIPGLNVSQAGVAVGGGDAGGVAGGQGLRPATQPAPHRPGFF